MHVGVGLLLGRAGRGKIVTRLLVFDAVERNLASRRQVVALVRAQLGVRAVGSLDGVHVLVIINYKKFLENRIFSEQRDDEYSMYQMINTCEPISPHAVQQDPVVNETHNQSDVELNDTDMEVTTTNNMHDNDR